MEAADGPGLGTRNVREPSTDLPTENLSRCRESLSDLGSERIADAEREQVDDVSHGVKSHQNARNGLEVDGEDRLAQAYHKLTGELRLGFDPGMCS